MVVKVSYVSYKEEAGFMQDRIKTSGRSLIERVVGDAGSIDFDPVFIVIS